jgi:hypothetical protein
MMTPIFYPGAVALFCLDALCMKKTSPYTRAGGTTYERRRTRKIVGVVLLIAGTRLFGIGVLSQISSSHL